MSLHKTQTFSADYSLLPLQCCFRTNGLLVSRSFSSCIRFSSSIIRYPGFPTLTMFSLPVVLLFLFLCPSGLKLLASWHTAESKCLPSLFRFLLLVTSFSFSELHQPPYFSVGSPFTILAFSDPRAFSQALWLSPSSVLWQLSALSQDLWSLFWPTAALSLQALLLSLYPSPHLCLISLEPYHSSSL